MFQIRFPGGAVADRRARVLPDSVRERSRLLRGHELELPCELCVDDEVHGRHIPAQVLFEQFRRVANFYFLLSGCLSFTPLAPYSAVSAILPLVVIGATMAKEGIEDWRRKQQDSEVNNRKGGKGRFLPRGPNLAFVKLRRRNLLRRNHEFGRETNLKLKQALEVTSNLQDDSSFKDFKAIVRCEDPNANLYSFVGSVELEGQQYPLSPQQILLRDSKLRNTDYIYGVIIFTGHDTKVMQTRRHRLRREAKSSEKWIRLSTSCSRLWC
uniref:P-type ATPase N-terminal domain-containing protein n=1 Tax=Ananas comosus var. bracteatus TaxID=296719 RepID=A0A6V7Q5U1_ANACO|nr:unnamed protein product [Ananas comosus var. bracteatus]